MHRKINNYIGRFAHFNIETLLKDILRLLTLKTSLENVLENFVMARNLTALKQIPSKITVTD